ncbi:MAG: hypothetical protein CMJ75_22805 [Planctomycetaceae bacterium]|nr:hypothetical protein [Planctomycetaceae bacterium]
MGLIHSIRVEGIGDPEASTASNKLYRWTYDRSALDVPSTTDPDSLYKTDSLLFWPSELSSSLDFQQGSVRGSSQTFRLRGSTEVWSWFYRLLPARVAFLEADLSSSGTSITLDTSGLSGLIYLEREALLLGTETSSKVYDCDRGVLETPARPHSASLTSDRAIYSTPTTIEGRLVQLIETSHSAGAYVESVLWSGVLRSVSTEDGGASITLQADDLLALIRARKILQGRASGKVSRVFWAGQVSGSVLQAAGSSGPFASGSQATGSNVRALALLGGSTCLEAQTFQSASESLDVLLEVVEAPYGQGKSLPESPESALLSLDLVEVFTTRSDSPSNYDTTGLNTLPLRQDLGELTLQLLTSTENGAEKGSNGAYDTGIEALAGSVPEALINTGKILQWGSDLGFVLEALFLGLKAEPEALDRLLQSLHKASLSILCQSRSGKIYVARLTDLEDYGAGSTLDPENILSVGIPQDRNLPEALDRSEVTFNHRPGLQPDQVKISDSIKYSRQALGESDLFAADLGGVRSGSLAQSIAQSIIQRFHEPIPQISLKTNRLEIHELGAVLSLTEDHLFNADGTRGGTVHKLLVVSRQEVFNSDRHELSYGLLDVGLIHNRDGWIAPSAQVASSSGADLTCESNVFTASYSDSPEDPLGTGSSRVDVDGFSAGDVLDLVDSAGTFKEQLIVESITRGSNMITTTTTPTTTPAAGDILRPSKYSEATTSQRHSWIFVAGSSELMPDASKPYTYRA